VYFGVSLSAQMDDSKRPPSPSQEMKGLPFGPAYPYRRRHLPSRQCRVLDRLRREQLAPNKASDCRFSENGRAKGIAALTNEIVDSGKTESLARADMMDDATNLLLVKHLKSLAGAGGFEPPCGGIKIRCLTAWLRPNAPQGWVEARRKAGRTIVRAPRHRNGRPDEICPPPREPARADRFSMDIVGRQ
jgi:hypothetical protein